jgi:hypothetical protein
MPRPSRRSCGTATAFAGRTARVITDPQLWPHLWVKNDGIVAAVAGDVTVRQMVWIAESLGPLRE